MGKFHWEVIIHHKVEKTLKRLHGEVLGRILKAFHTLEENPRPSGAKKMRGYKNLFRVRVGDWRIIYTINDEELIILILTLASRGKAYKKSENSVKLCFSPRRSEEREEKLKNI